MKKLFTLLAVSALGGAMTLGDNTKLQNKNNNTSTKTPTETPFFQPVNYTCSHDQILTSTFIKQVFKKGLRTFMAV